MVTVIKVVEMTLLKYPTWGGILPENNAKGWKFLQNLFFVDR
jgi:hypothetical protein